ncbi:MAG: HAD-IB family hydrolase [Rhodospirillaceae bacterium]|nr:HAD-IB family hydrolase [Rhodospirillaceae bacterium]
MIAVFDLDRTITTHGTFTPWLMGFVRRQPWRLIALPLVLIAALAYLLKLITRKRLKEVMLRCAVAGQRAELVAEVNAEFVAAWIPRRCRPSALAAIATHKKNGDKVVLATASNDVHVLPIAKALGIEAVVATRTEIDEHGRLTGRILGTNCYGAGKLEMVKAALGPISIPRVAYSDHHSDWQLLVWAGEGVAVNPNGKLRKLAAAHGMAIRDWN